MIAAVAGGKRIESGRQPERSRGIHCEHFRHDGGILRPRSFGAQNDKTTRFRCEKR
jgi:hypothetical protein